VFSLAVPVWEILTGTLRSLTVLANNVLVWVTRIPAHVEGSRIQLRAGTLEVAYSCAGINYLMSGLTLGACYALLFTTAWRTRTKVIVAAGAVSMLSNWIRVFGLVVVGHVTDMRSSLMKDHVEYGWIVFAAFLPLFFFFARRIEAHDAASSPAAHGPAAAQAVQLPFRRVVIATFFGLAGPLTYGTLSVSQQAPAFSEATPGIAWPVQLTNMPATAPEASWHAAFSGAGQHLDGMIEIEGQPVQVERFTYGVQDQAAEMIASDNAIADRRSIVGDGLVGPLDDELRSVNQAVMRTKDGNGRLAWYWYNVGGINTPSGARAKLLELLSFFRRQPSSQIVVVSSACKTGNCEPARRALFSVATGRSMPTSSTTQ
jgi:EpsI family protein